MLTRLLPPDKIVNYIVLFGAFFNALLAFMNANFMNIGTTHVIICELLTVGAAGFVILQRYRPFMQPWAYFAALFFVLFIFLSIINGFPNVKAFRDILLISTFGLLGACYRGNIIQLITFSVYLVLIFAFWEGFMTDSFLSLFNPGKYYFNTRGIGEMEDALGAEAVLFKNAGRYTGRFSLGIFDMHRLSSLFMEQTSLGTFNMFLTMFTSSFWKYLSRHQKILFPVTIFLLLGFVDSRLAIGIVGIVTAMHFVYRFIPAYMNLLYMPIALILCGIMFYDSQIVQMIDTLSGRIGWTMHLLASVDMNALLGVSSGDTPNVADSGYGYMIYFHSIIGMVAFWLFLALIIPQHHPVARYYAHHMTILLTLSLLLGAGIFSIKITAFIWFTAGYIFAEMKRLEEQSEHHSAQHQSTDIHSAQVA
ncbi:MAG: hypothetical protein AAF621_00355 [Pseudomonadota bacterium]